MEGRLKNARNQVHSRRNSLIKNYKKVIRTLADWLQAWEGSRRCESKEQGVISVTRGQVSSREY